MSVLPSNTKSGAGTVGRTDIHLGAHVARAWRDCFASPSRRRVLEMATLLSLESHHMLQEYTKTPEMLEEKRERYINTYRLVCEYFIASIFVSIHLVEESIFLSLGSHHMRMVTPGIRMPYTGSITQFSQKQKQTKTISSGVHQKTRFVGRREEAIYRNSISRPPAYSIACICGC